MGVGITMVIDHLPDGMILQPRKMKGWVTLKTHLHFKYEKYHLNQAFVGEIFNCNVQGCSCSPQQSSFGEKKRLNAQLHSTIGEVVCWGPTVPILKYLRDPIRLTACAPKLGFFISPFGKDLLQPCGRLWPYKKFGIWVFPKIEKTQNGWFVLENPYENGWFEGTTIFGNICLCFSPHPVVATATFGWLSPCAFEYSVHCTCCS